MEVYALVGAAGTGKSHRASLIAHELQVDLIVDDGLLIKDGKIIAGRSAKREETLVAAVRRAVFADPAHSAGVREKIMELKPARVLVLGTSRGMVNRITDALDIPRPEKLIPIHEVASHTDIQRALRTRKEQGKHVIPAPTFEVKRTFSGYLVDPLRLRFLRRGFVDRDRDVVVEKSVVRPTFSSLGRFYIADTVVASIAARACRQVDGVAKIGNVTVESRPEGVVIGTGLVLEYGVFIPDVLREAQTKIKDAVEFMTALNVLAVNVVAKRISHP